MRRTQKKCLSCKKIYLVFNSVIRKGHGNYCSVKCLANSRIGRIPWNKGKKMTYKHGMLGKHHSPETLLKISGKNANAWKGGVYKTNNRIRRSPDYIRWQFSTYKRDNNQCQICGLKEETLKGHHRLRANHIKKFADYTELRFNLNNGITICRDCDTLFVLRREEEWESYFNFNLETRDKLV